MGKEENVEGLLLKYKGFLGVGGIKKSHRLKSQA